MTILVLGVGNLLLSDEGVGVRVAEALEARYVLPVEVSVIDGGTAGMELLEPIANADRMILLDAVTADHPPGTLVTMEGEDLPAFFRTRLSPHQLGLPEVLATATLTGDLPNEMVLFGVVPESLKTGMELSSTVAGTVDELLGHVTARLEAWGVTVTEKSA